MKLLIFANLEHLFKKSEKLLRIFIRQIAEKEGFYVDENFGGHGIGKSLHMKPLILHSLNDMPEIM